VTSTVSQIMEDAGITSIHSCDREAAKAAIKALRALPSFQEKSWTNSFCHGRYTSPSAKWTAEDSTGRVQISWSVNAATGADNGYRISQDSRWDAATEREKASRQERDAAWANRCANKRNEADHNATWVQEQADRHIRSAHERIATARRARQDGDTPEALYQLALAAQDRRGAAHYLTYVSRYRAESARYSREIAALAEQA